MKRRNFIKKASATGLGLVTISSTLISCDETKEGKIVLADLFNHPFVKTPKTFTDGLYEIKMAFFGNKAGLIYFLNQETVVSPKMAEFATTESSQDGYRFGLKSRNKGKAYIEDQK